MKKWMYRIFGVLIIALMSVGCQKYEMIEPNDAGMIVQPREGSEDTSVAGDAGVSIDEPFDDGDYHEEDLITDDEDDDDEDDSGAQKSIN